MSETPGILGKLVDRFYALTVGTEICHSRLTLHGVATPSVGHGHIHSSRHRVAAHGTFATTDRGTSIGSAIELKTALVATAGHLRRWASTFLIHHRRVLGSHGRANANARTVCEAILGGRTCTQAFRHGFHLLALIGGHISQRLLHFGLG